MVRAPSSTTSRLLCSCWKQPPVGSRSANCATSPSPSSAHYETAAYGSIGPATVGERVGSSARNESTKERRLGKCLARLRLGRSGKKRKKCSVETAAAPDGYTAADVYDYIDGDGVENVGGPRVHPSTSHGQGRGIHVGTRVDTRYEYPIFTTVANTRPTANNHVQADEPLYTSASQIYSQAGSEDPYSSIVSDSRRNLAAPTLHRQQPSSSAAVGADSGENYSASSSLYADGGYARVREPVVPLVRSGRELGTTSLQGGRLNQLYAQINHQARRPQHPSLAAERNLKAQQRKRVDGSGEIHSPSLPPPAIPPRLLPPPTSSTTPRDCGIVLFSDGGGQAAESGSGSIVSRVSNGSGGSSRNPSYRYLTVRESVDVIRERIRRRDEEHRRLLSTSQQRPPVPNNAGVNTNAEPNYYPRQPHYYSTIANEYESLGGGSTSGGYSLLYESVRQPALAEAHTNADGSGVENGPTPSINNGDLTHSGVGVEAPAPPTSPIPSRLEPMTSAVMKTTTLSRRPIVISPMTTQRISDPGAVFENRGRTHLAARFFHGVHPAQSSDLDPPHPHNTGLANNGRAQELPATMTMTTSWTSTTEEGISGSQAEAETQTPPPSRIPRPRLLTTRSRSSSPSATSITSAGGSGSSSRTRPTSLPFTVAATQTTTPLFNASLEGVGAGDGRNVAVNTGNFRLRRLEPPPSPHGNDYISRVDLGEKRSWPLS